MADYMLEHARSGRAACKKCRSKITKGEVRLGKEVDRGDFVATSWFHVACVGVPKQYSDVSEIRGFAGLGNEEQVKLRSEFGSRTITGKRKRVEEVKKATAGASSAEAKFKKMRVKELRDLLVEKDLDKKGKKAELVARLVEAEVAEAGGVTIDADEAKELELVEQLNKKTVAQLKDLLRLNNQKMSGSKGDLVLRIADCMMYGCLPTCPECGGGRLRVTYDATAGHGGQGTFRCPGYMDDDEFVRCGHSCRTSDVERPKWREDAQDRDDDDV